MTSRCLHVIDQPGPAAAQAILRLSVDAARFESSRTCDQHAWLLFGGEATRDAARAIGLRDDQFRLLPRPTGLHRLLPASLAQPKRLMHQAHRVVCWTEDAVQIASLLGCAHVVRRVADVGAGPFAKRIIDQACRDSSAAPYPDRQSLRKRWGVADDTTVVALLGDGVDRIDSSAAAMALTLTHESLRATEPALAEVCLVCHPLAHQRAEASTLLSLLSCDRLLVQDASVLSPWSVLPGCDVALAPCPSEARLSILWADALGVSVVMPTAHAEPTLARLDRVIPARSAQPKHLADALTNWVQAQQPAAVSQV